MYIWRQLHSELLLQATEGCLSSGVPLYTHICTHTNEYNVMHTHMYMYTHNYTLPGCNIVGKFTLLTLIYCTIHPVPTVAAQVPFSIELIVGITVGVTVFISAVLFVGLVLICVMCRLCVHDKSSKPQIGQLVHA